MYFHFSKNKSSLKDMLDPQRIDLRRCRLLLFLRLRDSRAAARLAARELLVGRGYLRHTSSARRISNSKANDPTAQCFIEAIARGCRNPCMARCRAAGRRAARAMIAEGDVLLSGGSPARSLLAGRRGAVL